jgi:lysozyme
MKPSTNAYDFIKHEEGLVLHTYLDSASIPTIGFGTTRYKDGTKPKLGDTITEEQAEDLLKWEVVNKTGAISGLLKNVVLSQNQYDALVSFVYNVGVTGFAGSTLLKLIRANPKDPAIKAAFLMWDKIHVNGKLVESDGLKNRREREADLYFS